MRASLTRSSNLRSLAMSIPAGVAFFFLQRANLLADIPIWVILVVLWTSFLVGVVATSRWPDTSDPRQLHYRLAVQAAGTTATIYVTGWGPMLAVGYIVILAEGVRSFGSRSVRPGLAYCMVAMALGQAAIALGIAPTLVREPLVHGLAVLAALGTVFTAQLLASTTAQREESEETARVLLDLAHSLSRASTRQEIADRLVSSVPAIVGTDRAAVLLWDEERQGLTNVALAGYTPEDVERLRTLVVRPADWPLLAEVLADPAPRRYAADEAVNEMARELMERSQTAETLYVPVVIRGELFGIITGDRALGSAARPFTGELRQRLAGLADQAATAFDNARLLEQERETVARLREADRLKSEFLGIVSHELRTPLAVLLGAARTLHWRGDGLSDEVRSELLSSMIRRGDDLNRIVEDLLQASGTINLTVQAVDIADVCRSAVADASDLAPDRTIRCCADDKIVIVADEGRLRQVVENLLTNAMKYAPGSDIDVTAASRDGEVNIEVSDEGPGMTQDEVARAFDPFYQADSSPIRKVGGLGLGLYICRRIVEAHGGRITIDATPGSGTTVRFALPQVGAPATPSFSSVAPAGPRAPRET